MKPDNKAKEVFGELIFTELAEQFYTKVSPDNKKAERQLVHIWVDEIYPLRE